MKEVWKDCISRPGYQVSSLGRVRRDGSNVDRRLSKKTNGYLAANFCANGIAKDYSVHRLVMETFVGPCPAGKNVNHKDGNKLNNQLENLEYMSPFENIQHARSLGLQTSYRGRKPWSVNKVSLQTAQVFLMLSEQGLSQRKIASRFGCPQSTVCESIKSIRSLSAQTA